MKRVADYVGLVLIVAGGAVFALGIILLKKAEK